MFHGMPKARFGTEGGCKAVASLYIFLIKLSGIDSLVLLKYTLTLSLFVECESITVARK